MNTKAKENREKVKKTVAQVMLHVVLIISLVMVLLPLFTMIVGAFKSGTVYKVNKWLPSFPLRIENLSIAFQATKGYLFNTIVVAVLGIGGLIIISSMASFAMSKLKFIGNKLCFTIILSLTMLPGILSLTPQIILYKTLGLDNNIFALVLPMWTGGCVFGVFLLNGFYGGLPNETFEAADLDGANDFQKYVLIALPLSLPIIATLVIMQITNVWNDYMWPKLILREENYTIAAGLAFQFESSNVAQPIKYAGYLVSAVPVIFLFVFFNKFYVEGITSSGIKM